MAKFPFSKLPIVLQTSVLDSVRLRDALNLFQTTKSIHRHFLFYGLFPKKVNSLTVWVDFFYNEPIGNVKYQGFDEGDHFIFTASLEIQHLEDFGYEECLAFLLDIEDPRRQTISLFLISKVRSCKKLEIDFCYPCNATDTQVLRELFQGKKFLANIPQVANLELYGGAGSFVCEECDPISISMDFFCNHLPSAERGIFMCYFDFRQLFRKDFLKNTKVFHFQTLEPDLQVLSQARAEGYSITFFQPNKFLQTVATLLRRGRVPGLNPQAYVILTSDDMDYYSLISLFEENGDCGVQRVDRETGELRPLTDSEEDDSSHSGEHADLSPFFDLEEKVSKIDFTIWDTWKPIPREWFLMEYFQDKNRNLWATRTLIDGELDSIRIRFQVIFQSRLPDAMKSKNFSI